MTRTEDFNIFNPATTTATAELNSVLFKAGYPDAPGQRSERATTAPSDNLLAVRHESPETPEQRLNRRMTEVFGADVMEHLNPASAQWLADNVRKIADGFARVSGQEAWDMASAMRDRTRLPNGDHVIFLSRQDGPTRGNLIPKRHDVYVRGYHWYQSDTQVGQVYH